MWKMSLSGRIPKPKVSTLLQNNNLQGEMGLKPMKATGINVMYDKLPLDIENAGFFFFLIQYLNNHCRLYSKEETIE